MPVYKDQLGRTVTVKDSPQRIISLVPSQTELLFHLGLESEVVGITKFCVHPTTWFQTKTRVGGTKKVHTAIIKELKPDLIIANKEENRKEQVEELANDFPVWVSDVYDLPTAFEMMKSLGTITRKEEKALQITETIKNSFQQLDKLKPLDLRTAYLIWREPYMTVGGDTFIHQMLGWAGLENVFKNQKRYPVVTIAELQAANCALVLLSSEPYPFSQKHIDELQPHLPNAKIILVDGEMFSWYGSRLLQASSYLATLHRQLNS